MTIDEDFWRGRRVLVTGHTGFKGAWLSLWLQSLGAELTGLSSGPPTVPSLYAQADVGAGMREHRGDVRDAAAVGAALAASRAELVLHLAAQPMVRRSLREPALTWEVNVMGTINVLEAVRAAGGQVGGVLVVTSDKCYENPPGGTRAFVEGDALGGSDPYSSSKAGAELVAAAWRRSFFSAAGTPNLATARAGNVIGGGDRGEDRLLPDALRAVEDGSELLVRNPAAVRPWQHVLNPLVGYLLLARRLLEGPDAARAWNFGPPPGDARPVGWIVERLAELWEGDLRWRADERPNPPEAGHLELDSGAAERELGWRPAWSLEEALARIVEWHLRERAGENMREQTLAQIAAYG
ncbi:MAG TPA: CDP-glucose 4,6-dehydratase [Solirubrobacteraceae bacterium]|nr:CDP-glucose 4,6-dehydratase [Solirubrobacteraceae bacterium]